MTEKRGRKSAAELSVVAPIAFERKKLEPPPDLRREVAAVFREIVTACSPQHFVESDKPLLIAYCTAIHLSRWSADLISSDNGMMAIWEKSTRMVATLATRLRLAPQARSHPESVARRAASETSEPKPWEEYGGPSEA